nr:hypothetical protein [Tanacetum cinerariifolium]
SNDEGLMVTRRLYRAAKIRACTGSCSSSSNDEGLMVTRRLYRAAKIREDTVKEMMADVKQQQQVRVWFAYGLCVWKSQQDNLLVLYGVDEDLQNLAKTDMVKLMVEIESFGMSVDELDKETRSSDGLQPKQANLSCVHALNELHLHEIHVVPSRHEADQC